MAAHRLRGLGNLEVRRTSRGEGIQQRAGHGRHRVTVMGDDELEHAAGDGARGQGHRFVGAQDHHGGVPRGVAADYLGTAILGALITFRTFGICYPFSVVLMQRWRAKHSRIDGAPLVFTGSAVGLFGLWIKWFLLIIVTVGIYSLWVGPRIEAWKWEYTNFAGAPLGYPGGPGQVTVNVGR